MLYVWENFDVIATGILVGIQKSTVMPLCQGASYQGNTILNEL